MNWLASSSYSSTEYSRSECLKSTRSLPAPRDILRGITFVVKVKPLRRSTSAPAIVDTYGGTTFAIPYFCPSSRILHM